MLNGSTRANSPVSKEKKWKNFFGILAGGILSIPVLVIGFQACMPSRSENVIIPGPDGEYPVYNSEVEPEPTYPEFPDELIGPSDVDLPSLTPVEVQFPTPVPVPTPREPIVCEGDKVRYSDNGKKITAEGNIRVEYKDLEITADRVTVYVERREAYAEGNVALTQGDNIITADKIRYDFIKEQGTISPGEGYYDPWFGRADTVDVEGKEKVEFIEGTATTDDYDDPDYSFEAEKVTIYPDDKIIMNDVAVYVGSVPVFWLPYFRRSLKDDCRGSFIYPGYRNTWGFFLFAGYQWCAPGIIVTPHLDYRYRRGFAYGLDGRFYISDTGKGEWQTYYMKDQGYDIDDEGITNKERYLIEFDYKQSLFYKIQSYFSLNYLSDYAIRREFFRSEYDADSQPESYAYFSRRWDEVTLSLKIRPRLNDFYTVTEKLPEVKLQVQEFQLWDTDFYYQGSNSATNFKKKYGGEEGTRYESFRFDTYHEMAYSKKFFGWLNFYPSVSIRGDYYSRGPGDPVDYETSTAVKTDSPTPEPTPTPEPPDRRDFWRSVFSYSVGISTDIYGIFPSQNDWLEINKLRHVITPSIDYYYTDNPSVYYTDIYQFDSIDKIKRANYFKLGLRNQLQTKRMYNDMESSWTLADLILSTNLFTEPDRDNAGRLIGDLAAEFEVTPFPWLGFDLDLAYNTYDNRFREDTFDLWIRPENDWWLTFSHNYRQSKNRNRVSSELYLRINPIWAFQVYGRYDTVDGEFEEEAFTIYRDLHSWSSYLRFQHRNEEDEFSVYLALWIKAFSQSPLHLSN